MNLYLVLAIMVLSLPLTVALVVLMDRRGDRLAREAGAIEEALWNERVFARIKRNSSERV